MLARYRDMKLDAMARKYIVFVAVQVLEKSGTKKVHPLFICCCVDWLVKSKR